MEEVRSKQRFFLIMLALVSTNLCVSVLAARGKIGVDYGLNGDNLISPKKTVTLLRSKGIRRVRVYEPRPEVMRAFANSGIHLWVGVPNEEVPGIATDPLVATNWVTQNVAAYPSLNVSAIIVGNEWLHNSSQHDPTLLLPAMRNIYTALTSLQTLDLDLLGIKVSTAHAFDILVKSFPPSEAAFKGELLPVLIPLIGFLEETGSFFVVNIVPYFAYINDLNVSLELALFLPTEPVTDPNTHLNYTNLFDLQLDAVYAALGSAMATEGKQSYEDSTRGRKKTTSARHVKTFSGEVGWPSGPGSTGSVPPHRPPPMMDSMVSEKKRPPASSPASSLVTNYTCSGRECTATTVENARIFIQNLVRHVRLSRGTPANPTTSIEAFIFEVFNEDLKPPGPEQHFGLFYPNGSSVYPIVFH